MKRNRVILGSAIIFCLLLGWIILFKTSFKIAELDRIRGINLRPFYYKNETSFHFREVIMNLLAFIPLGIYLKMLRLENRKALLLGFGYSLLLEIMQFILKIGITDITDLMTNTLGVGSGIIIYMLLDKIFKNKDKLEKILTILAIIGTCLLCLLIFILLIVN